MSLNWAKLASKSGCAKFFVISSIRVNRNSSNFYLRTKGEMEEAIKSQRDQSIFILRPSLLLGKGENSGLWNNFKIYDEHSWLIIYFKPQKI